MTHERMTHTADPDPQLVAALAELEQRIQARYPDAAFTTFRGEDPEGLYLRVTVDLDDPDEVVDHVLDTLYEVQVERELPVYVVAVPPLERVADQLRTRSTRPAPQVPPHLFQR